MKRRQLSLFASGPIAERLERIRSVVDPVQAARIPAHVTLCREDEIHDARAEWLATRVKSAAPICLRFDKVERFSGHGIWLRCIDGQHAFQELRRHVLEDLHARDEIPHLTLAHPRNPRAVGNSLAAVDIALPVALVFDRLMLIEQPTDGERWTVLSEFSFASETAPNLSRPPTSELRGGAAHL